jgi:hypothetical protein
MGDHREWEHASKGVLIAVESWSIRLQDSAECLARLYYTD